MIASKELFLVFLFSFLFFSCRKDKPPEMVPVNVSVGGQGVFITNEGNFQFGNAKVSYYNHGETTATEDLFQPANKRPLGDVCLSMCLFNSKAYLVINNSGKIEVVNPTTFVSTATIGGLTSPRYFLPVSNSKAYVTDLFSNSIAIVDLSNNVVTGTIPCNGWTEELTLAYGKVFVTNQKTNKIYVINSASDVLSDSITVGTSSTSIKEDKNGKLWVLCSGSKTNKVMPSLHRFDPITNKVEQTFTFSSLTDNPWRLKINGSNDTLYFLNNGVCRMPIVSDALPTSTFIAQGTSNFYGLGIDPKSGVVYVADAIDYVQKGMIYRYTPQGKLLNTFLAGIIPGDFYFK